MNENGLPGSAAPPCASSSTYLPTCIDKQPASSTYLSIPVQARRSVITNLPLHLHSFAIGHPHQLSYQHRYKGVSPSTTYLSTCTIIHLSSSTYLLSYTYRLFINSCFYLFPRIMHPHQLSYPAILWYIIEHYRFVIETRSLIAKQEIY